MSAELMLWNALRYVAQTVLLIAIAEVATRALRLRAPRARLALLYGVLIGCVALPFVQEMRRPMIDGSGDGLVTVQTQITGTAVRGRPAVTLRQAVIGVAAAGAITRLLWLGVGLLRLRFRRRHARQLTPVPAAIEEAERAVGVRSAYFIDAAVSSPVAFGRTILLPARFNDLAPEARHAVITHELLHVKRGDWYALMAEELVRAALWWNPAVWWLLNQIQLAREQSVDAAVLEIGRDRESYLGALLEMASIRMEPDLAPAPLFLRRRHLRERVALIIDGGVMSKRHLKASMAFLSALLPIAAGLAIQLIPLQGAPQSDAPGVEIKSAMDVIHRTGVEYPASALQAGIGGYAVIDVRVNAKGEVTSTTPVSGPEQLQSALMRSVANWHFDLSKQQPEHFEVGAKFTPSPQGVSAGDARPIRSINLEQVPAALRDRVEAAISIKPGETPDMARVAETAQALRAIDEHLTIGEVRRGADRDLFVGVGSSKAVGQVDYLFAGKKYEYSGSPDSDEKRIKMGGNEAAAKLVHKVTPKYPLEAKQNGVQGTVQLTAVIDKEGKIKNLQLVSGHPLLVQSAIDAVQQWMYQTTLLNGDPVEVVTTIDVNYTLTK